jgi:L-threonylcarbamoyladenylate synthase
VENGTSHSAELLPTHTAALFEQAVVRTAAHLREGGVVALPTETVYGLAANALDARAVEKIYQAKGRPAHNPIIVHVSSVAMAQTCVRQWSATAEDLARAFWPGPLTLVLPRSDVVPDIVTGGGDTVGIRWPSHPFIQAVIRRCGFPLAAPSANPSNEVSPTNAHHVLRSLGHRIPLVVDGGQSQVGIESTVLDLSVTPARVLRPGMIPSAALLAVLERLDEAGTVGQGPLRSPGLLPKHYSPRGRLVLLNWRNDADLHRQLQELRIPHSSCHLIAYDRIPAPVDLARVAVIPHDAEAFARALYAELHACDEAKAAWIVMERPPKTPEWHGILDRLARASSPTPTPRGGDGLVPVCE